MPYHLRSSSLEAHQWLKNGDHPQDYVTDVHAESDQPGVPPVAYTVAHQKANGWEGQVVRRFRSPSINGAAMCENCHRPPKDHGWLDQGQEGRSRSVCPGDYIVKDPDGLYCVVAGPTFAALFDRTIPLPRKRSGLRALLLAIGSSINEPPGELREDVRLIVQVEAMSEAERDTLEACFEGGPLNDGDMPSKDARDKLVYEGILQRVIFRGASGFNACTCLGAKAFSLIQAGA